MAENYFKLAKTNKTALVASRRCYVIAAENALAISKLYKDDNNETKLRMQKEIKQNLYLVDELGKKIAENSEFDAKKVYMAQFDPVEQIIIEKSATIRGKYVELWTPATGIVK